MAEYPYTILPGKEGKKAYKPLINVSLQYKKTHRVTLPIKALIDSGADVCFCADYIGIWLGVSLIQSRQSTEFTAAKNQKFIATPSLVTLRVAQKTYEAVFYFTSVLPKNIPVILGQSGFFDKNKITFDAPAGIIEIE